MRQPDRLHLVHHALPHVPIEHWFSAYQIASVVYVGRGSPMPIQVKRIEAFLWQYVEVGQLDSREDRGVAPLFMRLAEPRPVTPLSEMLAGILHFHATRPWASGTPRANPCRWPCRRRRRGRRGSAPRARPQRCGTARRRWRRSAASRWRGWDR